MACSTDNWPRQHTGSPTILVCPQASVLFMRHHSMPKAPWLCATHPFLTLAEQFSSARTWFTVSFTKKIAVVGGDSLLLASWRMNSHTSTNFLTDMNSVCKSREVR